MKAKEPNQKSAALQDTLRAVAAFEQILEAIPNDRLALEGLFEAHSRAGNRKQAEDYLLRLAACVIEEEDIQGAAFALERIHTLGSKAAAVADLEKKLEVLAARQGPATTAAPAEHARRRAIDITAELTLAWDLVQAGELTEDDYANVVHDLSENLSKNVAVPVTVVHALHDRGFKALERILCYLSVRSGLPLINVARFEVQREAGTLLSLDYMRRRGAIVFDLMNKDALVAVLNPLDKELLEDVRKQTGRNCNFYVVSPESYDACLASITKLLEETGTAR